MWDSCGGASNTTVENPGLIRFEAAGDYTVKLTATDDKGLLLPAGDCVIIQFCHCK
ncbi:MAG: PKD domain-containing protein [Desulfomonilia bacterium]